MNFFMNKNNKIIQGNIDTEKNWKLLKGELL